MSGFQELIQSDQPVLVDFYAEWCGPCKMMAPELEKLKQIMGDRLRIVKVDVDKNQKASMNYQISGVPTLLLFRNGKILWRTSGAMDAGSLSKIISEKLN
jgi:thioredoxin 1